MTVENQSERAKLARFVRPKACALPCATANAAGEIHPAIVYAAWQTGVHRIFRIGGIQAVGAMAYGTAQVPLTYKIFGPGNQYVTCAKMLVNAEGTAIDMPAGPSEVAILADDSCVPAFVAADLLSQCEHGVDSQCLLVTTSAAVWAAVQSELALQLPLLPRRAMAEKSLASSRLVLVQSLPEAIEMINVYAAEHLIIVCENVDEVAEQIHQAGSIFVGNYAAESVGDYASGTNHTLPTNGYASAYSGVSLDSFYKKITFQKLSAQGLRNIGRHVEIMAEAEGLQGHKNAVTLRLAQLDAEDKS